MDMPWPWSAPRLKDLSQTQIWGKEQIGVNRAVMVDGGC